MITISAPTMNETVTINRIKYTVVAIVPVDPVKYPNRAKHVCASVYMRRGNGKNLYLVSVSLSGLIRVDRTPVTCGCFSDADIAAMNALSTEVQ